jgi:hypothetical protein
MGRPFLDQQELSVPLDDGCNGEVRSHGHGKDCNGCWLSGL